MSAKFYYMPDIFGSVGFTYDIKNPDKISLVKTITSIKTEIEDRYVFYVHVSAEGQHSE